MIVRLNKNKWSTSCIDLLVYILITGVLDLNRLFAIISMFIQ